MTKPPPNAERLLPPRYRFETGGNARHAWSRGAGLLKQLTMRHLVDRYRASYLGFLWSFFNPILMMVVYSFVFRFIFRAEVPGVPYLAHFITAYLAWNFFSVAVANSAASVVAGTYLLNKASFPRFLLPVSAVLSNMVNYLVTIPIMVVFLLYLGVYPGWSIVLLPFALVLLLLLAGGMGLLVASVAPFFRDLLHLLDIVLMAWFFSTPIVYHISYVQDRVVEKGWPPVLLDLYRVNPMVGVIGFIQATLFGQPIPVVEIAISCAWGAAFLVVGVWVFNRCSPHFCEV